MNCPTIELSLWMDGALEPERARIIEEHVKGCASCAALVKSERSLRTGLLVLACPAGDTLARFVDGTLENAAIGQHVKGCAECAEVVEWTREAQASFDSGELPKASGRRKRPQLRKPKRPNIIQFAVPLAAAAALLLAVLFLLRAPERPQENEVATEHPKPPAPIVPPRPQPTAPKEQPATPPAPIEPSKPPEETHEVPAPPAPPVEQPQPAPPVAPPAPAPGTPGETEKPGENPPRPPVTEATVAIANVGGDLRVGPSREKATRVTGNVTVTSRDLIFASALPGRFEINGAPVLLAPSSEARLDPTDLTLEKGEVFSEGTLELACHGVTARPDKAGAQLVLRAVGSGAQLYVSVGSAVFTSAGGSVTLAAGEASEVESPGAAPTRAHKGEASAWISEARADRILAEGLDYPRAFLAAEALRSAKAQVQKGVLLERMRALHAIEAARASDERLARVANEIAGQAADSVFDELVKSADALSAPEAGLAVLARVRRLPAQKDALSKTFAGLGKLVEKATPAEIAELSRHAGSLLVLKAFEKAGARIRGIREHVLAEAVGAEGDLDWLARVTLAGGSPDDVDMRFKKLDANLAKDAVVPANRLAPLSLLAYERAQAVVGKAQDDDRRFFKALEHLAAAGARPCAGTNAVATLLVLSGDAHVLQGRPLTPPPASVVILERKDGKLEVTFTIESAKHPRSLVLSGTWDSWAKDKESMTRRKDGSFVETIVLPRGRYPYKMHNEAGQWETDARNPLYESDGLGGNNSVLMIE